MKHKLIGLLVCLFCLTTLTHAEIVTTTHEFHVMSGDATQIDFSDDDTKATTPLLTYTCSGGAKFGVSAYSYEKIAIFFEEKDATVTTTIIDNLKKVYIKYFPGTLTKADLNDIVVELSSDGTNWQTATVKHITNEMSVELPSSGDYALRVQANSSKTFYIHTMEYKTEKCACYPYIKPE